MVVFVVNTNGEVLKEVMACCVVLYRYVAEHDNNTVSTKLSCFSHKLFRT